MPLIAITAQADQPTCHTGRERLEEALSAGLAAPGPVMVMVHGYKFSPGLRHRCPHRHILAMNPIECWKARSWPRELGFGAGHAREGLGLSFGWHATGTIWQAHSQALLAARALARLIALLRRLAPTRRVHLVGHSLGARVILNALADLAPGDVGRIILLNGAEYGQTAQAAMQTPAGRRAELFNVTTRENDVFEFLFERVIAPPVRGDRSLAQSLPEARNVLTLEIDRRKTLLALRDLGFAIARPDARICHWSAYLRPGVFDLYRALLRGPERLPMAHLRAALPARPAPRWSRMVGLSDLEHALPVWGLGHLKGSASHRSQKAVTGP